jgi:serine/threonine-protein kinase
MKATFKIIKGPEKGRIFELTEAGNYIGGRSDDAQLMFSEEDPYISRNHFILEVAPPNVYFKDIDGIRNPSQINGLHVDTKKLVTGDVIVVGFTHLKATLDMEIPTQVGTCRSCGKSINIIQGENPIQTCDECHKRLTPPAVPRVRQAQRIFCEECGKDITQLGNSDGRADELFGKVGYCCSSCVPAPKEKPDISAIGDYEIIKLLGKGGMGSVFLAYHRQTARLVAVKTINIQRGELADRFSREIRIMQKIDHPNVISYIDTGQVDKTRKPYVVMAYAKAGNLDEQFGPHMSTPIHACVNIIIESLKGLDAIHKKGIVHRDIKPKNIVLHSHGKTGVGWNQFIPQITDFGLSKDFSRAGGPVVTRVGDIAGSPFFMPPEQVKGLIHAREYSDTYSMGTTLYYILTGKYPFNYPTNREIYKFMKEDKDCAQLPGAALKKIMGTENVKPPFLCILQDEPISIRERRADIPSGLAEVLDKAIKKEISARYQSATEFREALEKVM